MQPQALPTTQQLFASLVAIGAEHTHSAPTFYALALAVMALEADL